VVVEFTNRSRYKFYYSRLGRFSGLYPNAVEVIETNAANCPGTPILLDVFVLDLSGNLLDHSVQETQQHH
jgi:hypothetical protein